MKTRTIIGALLAVTLWGSLTSQTRADFCSREINQKFTAGILIEFVGHPDPKPYPRTLIKTEDRETTGMIREEYPILPGGESGLNIPPISVPQTRLWTPMRLEIRDDIDGKETTIAGVNFREFFNDGRGGLEVYWDEQIFDLKAPAVNRDPFLAHYMLEWKNNVR